MSLALSQSYTAIGPGLTVFFLATGGTEPYTYLVSPGGAGGTIDDSSGEYHSPVTLPINPALQYDTIVVTDSATPTPAVAQKRILVGSPLILFCDVLQTQLNLDSSHVYLWDQKIFEPTDFGLYVVVSVLNCKSFGNNRTYDSSMNCIQTVNMLVTLGIDIFSRGPAARDQKELVVAALNSNYSEQQQEANGFYIARTPIAFTNVSIVDGTAIPYRYHILVNMQYTVTKSQSVSYFDTFEDPTVTVNP